MAGYGDSLPAVAPPPAIAWLGLDSSKRQSSPDYVFVVHSSADFAVKYLDSEDLEAVKLDLLTRASLPLPDWSSDSPLALCFSPSGFSCTLFKC
jgi:predicted NAD/FAD-dependent oxidoreductase